MPKYNVLSEQMIFSVSTCM